jgi:hypothetical protein
MTKRAQGSQDEARLRVTASHFRCNMHRCFVSRDEITTVYFMDVFAISAMGECDESVTMPKLNVNLKTFRMNLHVNQPFNLTSNLPNLDAFFFSIF